MINSNNVKDKAIGSKPIVNLIVKCINFDAIYNKSWEPNMPIITPSTPVIRNIVSCSIHSILKILLRVKPIS